MSIIALGRARPRRRLHRQPHRQQDRGRRRARHRPSVSSVAIVGGFLFSLLGAAPVTGFNIYSLFVAVIGAIVVLIVYHALVDRRRAL